MAGRSNARRQVKRIKRDSEEYKNVVESCMFLCTNEGIPINFGWELPNLIEALLKERREAHAPANAQSSASEKANNAYARLEASTGQGSAPQAAPRTVQRPVAARQVTQQSQPLHQIQQKAPPAFNWDEPEEAAPQKHAPEISLEDAWGAAVDGAANDLGNVSYQSVPHSYEEDDYDSDEMSPEEIQRKFEEGQTRMLQRIESQGISYKHSAGPSAGQKIAVHEKVSTLKPGQIPPPAGFTASQGRTDDGTPRMKGGMTRNEAMDMIERASGKRPSDPGTNPNIKPSV